MREELLTRMIRLYGFEHEAVIQFARLMENKAVGDESLLLVVESHEKNCWGFKEMEEIEEDY